VTGAGHAAAAALLRNGTGVSAARLAELIGEQLATLGCRGAAVWLADIPQVDLVQFGAPDDDTAGSMGIEGTLAGRAYQTGELVHGVEEDDGGSTVWLPVCHGDERLGVLGGYVEDLAGADREDLSLLAGTAAVLLLAHARWSDAVLCTRRRQLASLAAEIQWALLPPTSSAGTGAVSIGGALEPAYDIGGDSFDYEIGDGVAQLGLFDAMGHGVNAAMMASVAVAAYRQARRSGHDMQRAYEAIDAAVSTQFGPDRFVTGLLVHLDVATGVIRYLAAGHHPAVLLRQGAVVGHLTGGGRLPFGLGAGIGPLPLSSQSDEEEIGEATLEPGDRLLLYTDGVTEARDQSGEVFGPERLEDLLVRADASKTSVPETLRRLVHAVLEHQEGHLQDDATVVMLQWHS
jgi:hypothetical protein